MTEDITLEDGRMTASAAAKYLGFSIRTLATWRWHKQGPPYIKCGRIFYFKKDLDDWIKQTRHA